MEHLEHLNKIMAKYDAALDEVSDAQKYAKEAIYAKHSEAKDLYLSMAKQELSHAKNLCRIADIILDTDDAEHVRGTKVVWDEMKAHIDAWSMEVRERIDRVERNR